jgi:hypothetical protein
MEMAHRFLADDSIPEMVAPPRTLLTAPPIGYSRDLEMRMDGPYFNASAYCNKINLRFSMWLRHPATVALLQAFNNYYREACHDTSLNVVMIVKSGARVVHTMMHDALSTWCDFQLLPPTAKPRLPSTTIYIYTPQSVAQAISGARGGTY